MNDIYNQAGVGLPSGTAAYRKTSRAAPKSNEQLLAEAEKRAGSLRAKVIANRGRLRMQLVDDLYKKYSVDPIANDMSESRRLEVLRAKLGF